MFVYININTINAHSLNKSLEFYYKKCLMMDWFKHTVEYIVNNIGLIILMLTTLKYLSSIIALYSLITYLSLFVDLPILFICVMGDYYICKKCNISFLLIFKKYKDYIHMLLFFYLYTTTIIDSNNILMLCFYFSTIFSALTLLYINIINKSFKKKYPYLFYLINIICIIQILIATYTVYSVPTSTPNGTSSSGPNQHPGGGPNQNPGGGPNQQYPVGGPDQHSGGGKR